MCRLLFVRSEHPFDVRGYLDAFARVCQHSPEYQGHGWGAALKRPEGWQLHKSIAPIWEAGSLDLGKTRCLVAHARSAFRNEGIAIENNMPFLRDGFVFVFNGELRQVSLSLPGRTGAEKIFQLIQNLDRGDRGAAFRLAVEILSKRARYLRALNMLLTDGNELHIASRFGESPEYFTLHRKAGDPEVVCSEPLGPGFQQLPNGYLQTLAAPAGQTC